MAKKLLCGVVVYLGSVQGATGESHGKVFSYLALRKYCAHAFTTGVRGQNELATVIGIPQDWRGN